jgi:6-phosphogluconolactonase
MSHYVYAPVKGDNRVLVFSLDPSSGKLSLSQEDAIEGVPYVSGFSPKQDTFYVSTRTPDGSLIHCYSVNQGTGGLTSLGDPLSLDVEPAYLSIDNTGRFLLMAYYSAGIVTVHSRNEDGTIDGNTVQRIETEKYAHYIKTDATNRYAFVPHVESANSIYQFLFDETTGRLTPNKTPKVAGGPGQGPRHLGFHPTLDMVYADNEQECSVTVYRFDKTEGTLQPVQSVSTLPEEEFEGAKSNAQLHMHPDGRSVYASNRGPDSIAMFRIDPATGLIESLGQQSVPGIPRPFGIDPDGDFLFAGGDASSVIVVHRIDEVGRLTPLESYEIGEATGWIVPAKFA